MGNIQGKGDIRVTDVENTQETLDADFKNVENFENIHVTDVENTQKKYGGCDSGKVENFGNIRVNKGKIRVTNISPKNGEKWTLEMGLMTYLMQWKNDECWRNSNF